MIHLLLPRDFIWFIYFHVIFFTINIFLMWSFKWFIVILRDSFIFTWLIYTWCIFSCVASNASFPFSTCDFYLILFSCVNFFTLAILYFLMWCFQMIYLHVIFKNKTTTHNSFIFTCDFFVMYHFTFLLNKSTEIYCISLIINLRNFPWDQTGDLQDVQPDQTIEFLLFQYFHTSSFIYSHDAIAWAFPDLRRKELGEHG